MNYTEIKFEVVTQITRGKLGFCKVRFEDIEKVVRFTARMEEKTDPLSTKSEQDEIKIENHRFYQRIVNDSRTDKIQQFIIGEAIKEYKYKNGLSKTPSLGLFPTSTIIAVNTFPASDITEYEKEYYLLEKDVGNQITLCYKEDDKIFLPQNNEVALIVDGQHRIAALRELYKRVNEDLRFGRKNILDIVDSSFIPFLKNRINNFEFLCTLLIDFDIFEQGEIFASVNFNQKPVDRSLYYDIFGSSPNTDKNELKLAHNLVSHLNYNEHSVLKGLIDMLGNGEGIVSQSAVMENLMKLFGKGKCWNLLYMDYRSDGEAYKTIGLFLRLYFKQIKITFKKYWPAPEVTNRKDYDSIIVKTTGMGAFIRLINDIYPDIISEYSIPSEDIEKGLENVFAKIANNGDDYFSKKGNFMSGGGQGLQSKLYKQLAFDLGYRTSID